MLEPRHRKTAKKFNLAGHAHFLTFSCYKRLPLLTNETWRMWLAQAIRRAGMDHNVALWAYVFMPDHVHLLLKPREQDYDLSRYEKSAKLSCSKRIINALVRQKSPLLDQLRVRERPAKWCYRFWQEGGGYDRNIVSMEEALEKARYCHHNPVTRGCVTDPAAWRWSSFRWIECGSRADEPLPLDAWDEH
jgi:putative transposase